MMLTSAFARRALSPRVAYALVASVIGLALFASGTPSPLYDTYRQLWGLSPVVLTLVYATYAFGVLATLALAGRVSDEVGRRPVLLASLGTLMGATIIFMLADSVAWLFAQLGVGLTNGVVSAAGMGLGVLVSAVFAELLPAPRVLPYVALFVLFGLAFSGALRMPEPVAGPAANVRDLRQRHRRASAGSGLPSMAHPPPASGSYG
ncbi:MAG TPA: MFS transporter [Pseudonocardiaceae bacterium]